MNPEHYEQKVAIITAQILSLREDFERVKTDSIKRNIGNIIFAKAYALELLKSKYLDKLSSKTPKAKPSPKTEAQRPPGKHLTEVSYLR